MKKLSENLETALTAAAMGIACIPVLPGTKLPAIRWKQWQTAVPPEALIRHWFEEAEVNIAIITTGMVLFDCENEAAAEFVLQECGDTSHKVKTPGGGIHLGFRKRRGVALRNQVKVKGMDIDIRTDGGLELIPRSWTDKGRYAWLGSGLQPVAELPIAHIGWTRPRRKKLKALDRFDAAWPPDWHRGHRYVDCFERAISGQGGHRATFIAALKIVRFANFDPDLAWRLLRYFNATKCDPPWREETELRHKLEEAMRLGRRS